jgi:hypothetical protein
VDQKQVGCDDSCQVAVLWMFCITISNALTSCTLKRGAPHDVVVDQWCLPRFNDSIVNHQSTYQVGIAMVAQQWWSRRTTHQCLCRNCATSTQPRPRARHPWLVSRSGTRDLRGCRTKAAVPMMSLLWLQRHMGCVSLRTCGSESLARSRTACEYALEHQ